MKKKVTEKKITVKKYKEKVTKLREHMTISLTNYQTQMHEWTVQWESGSITQEEYESKTTILKRRLKTTLKVQKIRQKKGKPGCIPASSIKELLNCDTCIKAAQRIRAELAKDEKKKKTAEKDEKESDEKKAKEGEDKAEKEADEKAEAPADKKEGEADAAKAKASDAAADAEKEVSKEAKKAAKKAAKKDEKKADKKEKAAAKKS